MDDIVETWMTGYRLAWESNTPQDIRALFTPDAEYLTEPYAEPWRGIDRIVEGWLAGKDEPGDTTFEWSLVTQTDDVAIVQAVTVYAAGRTYDNLWVIRFAGDRASSFVEWWMKRP